MPLCNDSVSEKAVALSERGASKGGIARAEKFDSETRKAIAAQAAPFAPALHRVRERTRPLISGQAVLQARRQHPQAISTAAGGKEPYQAQKPDRPPRGDS